MPKLKPGTILPTDAEDKEIIRQAKEDGTLMTDEQLAQMKPISEFPELEKLVKRGRPPKAMPKEQITLRLDPEILTFFRSRGKGWQTEINAILQKHVESQTA